MVLAILSPFFSSISTIFQSQATKQIDPLIVTSIGSLFGSLILFLILLIRKRGLNLEKIKENRKAILIMTLLRPLLGQLILAYGLSLTTGIKAIFFTKSEPYFVLFWHWVIKKEKIKPKYLILLIFHVMGAIILSTGGDLMLNKPQIGDLLIIIAMGLLSLSYFYGKILANNIGAQKSNAITLGLSGIFLLPFALISNPFPFRSQHPTGWLYLLIFVLLFNIIGLTFWFSSLKSVAPWIVSALRSLGPIVGVPVAYFVFGESLSFLQIFGGIIVLLTSFFIAREHLNSS